MLARISGALAFALLSFATLASPVVASEDGRVVALRAFENNLARVVEARVVDVHVLEDVSIGDGGRHVHLAEIEVLHTAIGSPEETRLVVQLDEDDPRELGIRKSDAPAVWILAPQWTTNGDRWRQRCGEISGGRPWFRLVDRLPVRRTGGVERVDVGFRLSALPASVSAIAKRDASDLGARWVPRAELFDVLRELATARGLECDLELERPVQSALHVLLRNDGRGSVTDLGSLQRRLLATPDEIAALRAVVERERFHELPFEVGVRAPGTKAPKTLRVDTERGTQIVELFDAPSVLASSEERERYERAKRVVDAFEALVARAIERVEPPAR